MLVDLIKGHLFLDFGNGTAWVQALWTRSGTVHDSVTSVQGHGVLQHLLSDLTSFVSGVNQPSVGLHQHSWTQVLLLVPPVRRTRRRAAGTQDALVKTVQLGSVLDTLQILSSISWGCVSLQVWLDGFVLLVEVGQVGDQVTNNVHVGQRIDLGIFGCVCIYSAQACQCVLSTNVHGTRATDTFSARPSEG